MIPIVAVTNFINSAMSIAVGMRLVAARKRHSASDFNYFIFFFFALALFWFFIGLPGLLAAYPLFAALSNTLSYVALFAACSSLIQTSFLFRKESASSSIINFFIFCLFMIFLVGRTLAPLPQLEPEIMPPYIFWKEIYPEWLKVIVGVVALVAGGIFIATFSYLGWKNKNNALIFHRSLFLVSGLSIMITAAALYYLFSSGGFMISIVASSLSVAGYVFMMRGVLHAHENQ